MEYTLSIIKPDAVERNLVESINEIFTSNGLAIVAQKRRQIQDEKGQEFYKEHASRPFYGELVEYITSGPVVIQVLAGKDAIKKHRDLMGATNPADAAEGTIRKLFAESISRNSVHGSDSEASAKREIDFFFNYDKISKVFGS